MPSTARNLLFASGLRVVFPPPKLSTLDSQLSTASPFTLNSQLSTRTSLRSLRLRGALHTLPSRLSTLNICPCPSFSACSVPPPRPPCCAFAFRLSTLNSRISLRSPRLRGALCILPSRLSALNTYPCPSFSACSVPPPRPPCCAFAFRLSTLNSQLAHLPASPRCALPSSVPALHSPLSTVNSRITRRGVSVT